MRMKFHTLHREQWISQPTSTFLNFFRQPKITRRITPRLSKPDAVKARQSWSA
jgi:hypothetical protein